MRAGMWRRVLRPIETSMKAEGYLPSDSARRPQTVALGHPWSTLGCIRVPRTHLRCFVWTMAAELPSQGIDHPAGPPATERRVMTIWGRARISVWSSRLASSLVRPPRRAGRSRWRSTDLSVEWPSNVGVGDEAGGITQRSVQLVEPGNPTQAEHPNQGEVFGYLGRELNFVGAYIERLAF